MCVTNNLDFVSATGKYDTTKSPVHYVSRRTKQITPFKILNAVPCNYRKDSFFAF